MRARSMPVRWGSRSAVRRLGPLGPGVVSSIGPSWSRLLAARGAITGLTFPRRPRGIDPSGRRVAEPVLPDAEAAVG